MIKSFWSCPRWCVRDDGMTRFPTVLAPRGAVYRVREALHETETETGGGAGLAGIFAVEGGSMALVRKGPRRIVVDGTAYRRRLRGRPTCFQGLAWSPCTFAVEHADAPGMTLVVTPPSRLSRPASRRRPLGVAQGQLGRTTSKGPTANGGPFDIVPGEALAEDTRFELVPYTSEGNPNCNHRSPALTHALRHALSSSSGPYTA